MRDTRSHKALTRRDWLAAAAAGAAAALPHPAAAAPAARVAVARAAAYDATVLPALRTMFDGLGGIGKLVAGKTVAIKINMSGSLRDRNGFVPAWRTHWTHPVVVGAAVRLLGEAGAKRIRILEGSSEDDHPLEENMLIGGWDPQDLLKAAPAVEMENTGGLGTAKQYKRLTVPGGGLIYPAFDVNHSWAECDVVVSIAKLKQHRITGVSLSLKNMTGVPPGTIYGDSAGFDVPALRPFGARTMFHTGKRQPPEGTPPERDTTTPREYGYRVPRITVDIARARPVDLAIIDGIESQTAAENADVDAAGTRTPKLVKPGVLMAGLSPVSTDAVAMAVMGLDPMAKRGAAPFERCDNTLALAEEAGLGTRDLRNIEIAGAAVSSVRFPFPG